MARTNYLTETKALEQFRISLENAEKQPEIAAIMAEFGYPAEILAEGKVLLTKTRKAYDTNKQEADETTKAYKDYAQAKQEMDKTYILDRKKAKVIFRKDPVVLHQLALVGRIPKAHINWIEVTRKFYSELSKNPHLQEKVARLKITPEGIAHSLEMISTIEATRTEYMKEQGESQLSRQQKDEAFAIIETWMSEFYAIAKIALDDKVKLMKALGKIV